MSMTKGSEDPPEEATHALLMLDLQRHVDAFPQVATCQWFGWNIAMDTQEILTHAVQTLQQAGVQNIEGGAGFRTGIGPKRQAVTFFTASTDDTSRSFCVLAVSDPSHTQAEALCHHIRDKLQPGFGLG